MSVQLHLTDDSHRIYRLEQRIFPGQFFEGPESGNTYWIAVDETNHDVGYASARPSQAEVDALFLSRAAVSPWARGRGIHRDLIAVRVQHAAAHAFPVCVTYTAWDNVRCGNNLIACGFRLYRPPGLWGGEDVMYFRKLL